MNQFFFPKNSEMEAIQLLLSSPSHIQQITGAQNLIQKIQTPQNQHERSQFFQVYWSLIISQNSHIAKVCSETIVFSSFFLFLKKKIIKINFLVKILDFVSFEKNHFLEWLFSTINTISSFVSPINTSTHCSRFFPFLFFLISF